MSLQNVLDGVWAAGLIDEYHALRTLFELLEPTTVAMWEREMREYGNGGEYNSMGV